MLDKAIVKAFWRVAPVVVTCTVMCLCPTSIANAQRGRDASLVGSVTDSTGAALQGVTIVASGPQLIAGSLTAVSDEAGNYRFQLLPPGTYALTATRAGFATTERRNVALPPGITLTIDLSLPLAALSQQVAISARPPVIDVKSSASPTLIEAALLNNLPLQRNMREDINLAPGISRLSALGGSVHANPLSLDGASGNEPGWGTPVIPLTRAWVEEVQIVSSGAGAQHGESTGGLFNAITRSGTDRFATDGEFWTTRNNWTGNNRGRLTPALSTQFHPLQVLERWEGTVRSGGPLVAHRLRYFAGAQRYRNDTRPAAFSAVPRRADEPKSTISELRGIGKLNASLRPGLLVDGFVARNTFVGHGTNAGPLVQPVAQQHLDDRYQIWNARAQWTIDSNRMLEMAVGGNHAVNDDGPSPDRRAGPAPHFDNFTSVQSVNFANISQANSRVTTASASMTQFTDDNRFGAHELRFGIEHERARLHMFSGYPGNRLYLDLNGVPDTVNLWNGATYRGRHRRTSAYMQDAWSAKARLTVNAGLRFNAYDAAPPYVADYHTRSIAPRVGLAWDVAGDHRSVVRAHYGRYFDPMVTSYYDFLDPSADTPFITAAVLGPNEFSVLSQFLASTGYAIDPDISQSFVEEFVGGAERELGAGISLRAQLVVRDFKDTVSFVDERTDWIPTPVVDPGPDNRRGTDDDGPMITIFRNGNPGAAFRVMTNPPQAYHRYRGVQVVAARRYSDGWGAQASYSWGRATANFDNSFSSNAANADNSINSVFVNPNRAINNSGVTGQNTPHAVKAFGTVTLPWVSGVIVSANYRYEVGPRWNRLVVFTGLPQGSEIVRVEPRTRRIPTINTVDIRVEKTLRFDKLKAGVFADVFNVSNAGVAAAFTANSGPRFGLPSRWIEPRTLRVGARVGF